LRNDGRKGIKGRRQGRQKQLEEEDYIIAKWAQEDVATLYKLLNKICIYEVRPKSFWATVIKHISFYMDNMYTYVSNLISLTFVILVNTSLHVSGVPCSSSGDTILPGQPLW
jgi:hypothetical protein